MDATRKKTQLDDIIWAIGVTKSVFNADDIIKVLKEYADDNLFTDTYQYTGKHVSSLDTQIFRSTKALSSDLAHRITMAYCERNGMKMYDPGFGGMANDSQKIYDETYQGIFDSIIDIVNSVSKEITKCR